MDTTNSKAGSAALAACALFLLCLASAGCRGGGANGAAGQEEGVRRRCALPQRIRPDHPRAPRPGRRPGDGLLRLRRRASA